MKESPLQGWYAPSYAVVGVPMQARLAITAERVRGMQGVRVGAADPLPADALRGLHESAYLDAFMHGHEPLASSQGVPWSPALRDAMLAMLGGQLAAFATARREGVSFNLARGFHHAVPECGSGYCAINGLALLAFMHPQLKVMVIDCDEHGGNGTEAFARQLPNLYAVSIFGTRFGCRGGTRSWALPVSGGDDMWVHYTRALEQAFACVDTVRPDIVLYQAGADCHRDDPKGRVGLSSDQMHARDVAVFTRLHAAGVPVAFCLGGGYQDAHIVAGLNANTVRAALTVHAA